MATWLALAGFLALIGLPLYLMWNPQRSHRDGGADGPDVGGGVDLPSDGHSGGHADGGGGDGGGGGGSSQ